MTIPADFSMVLRMLEHVPLYWFVFGNSESRAGDMGG